MKTRLRKLGLFLRALFPSRLPVGMTEFDQWSDSFSDIFDMPTSNKESIKFTLASIIMHLGAQDAYKSKFYFYLTMKAGAAKQVAGSYFYEIKQQQKLAAEEAAKKAQEASNESAGPKV